MTSENIEDLKRRIRDLEKEIEIKDGELDRSHKELLKVNTVIEKVIGDMSQELKLAALIQRVLSPTEIPHITGVEFSTKFVPGMKYGGDYFDIFEHEDKLKFGIILSSCSGYAMSALFLSVLIKMSVQIEARKGMDPHQVIEMMAKELVPNIQSQDKASLFYAIVDRRTFDFKYCSIGQITGLLQRQGQESLLRLEPTAGYLTQNFQQPLMTSSIALGPRDRLVLCTEGVGGIDLVTSAINRVPRSGVHDLRNEILFQVEQQAGKSEPVRDQTVIVTEVKDRVIKLAKK